MTPKNVLSTLLLAVVVSTAHTALAGDPQAESPIPLGFYECRISKETKFQPCTIEMKQGEPTLTIKGGLVDMEGVLHADDRYVVFDGRITSERPFGCYACDAKCDRNPDACSCKEVPSAASADCVGQPLLMVFAPSRGGWRAMLPYRIYQNVYEDVDGKREPVGYEYAYSAIEVTLKEAK